MATATRQYETTRTGIAWDTLVAIMQIRRQETSPLLNEMLRVRDAYNADIVYPSYQKPDEPVLSPLTPLLVAETVDNVALRAASVFPGIYVPALDPSKRTGVRSSAKADLTRKVLQAVHFHSRSKVGMRRVYRHLAGYASAAMTVTPDLKLGLPRIEVRDPLQTFPDPQSPEDLSPPKNVGFIIGRSAAWLRDRYPAARAELGGPVAKPGRTGAEMWDTVEWLDETHCIIGIVGPREAWQHSAVNARERGIPLHMELLRYEHHGNGRVPGVVLPRVTLDRVISSVAHTLGTIDVASRMMHLWMMAQEKAIFPDKWAVAQPGQAPAIVSHGGTWQDGRTGNINLLEGVAQVGETRSTPDPMTGQFIDRLERNMRVSTGLNPTFGGETYGSLRTGRGIDSMLGASVDPRVQEVQEIAEYGLTELNTVVLDCLKGWWEDSPVKIFTGKIGDSALVEVKPTVDIETTFNVVRYPAPGSDLQGTTIRLSQLYGAKVLSLQTFRQLHPDVEDDAYEEHQVDVEELELAILEGIKQKAAAGELDMVFLARITELRQEGKSITEAVSTAHAEAQELQATQEEPTPPGEPDPAAAMPGLAGPAMAQVAPGGAPAPLEPGPPIAAAPGQDNLAGLMATLEQIG